MKRRTALILALILILAVVLSACGNTAPKPSKDPVTKDALMGAYRTKAEAATGLAYKMLMDMKIGMSVMGQSQDVAMNGEMSVEATNEAAHISGSMVSSSQGQTETTKTETYTIKNGDAFDVYTLVDGTWYKTTAPELKTSDIQGILALQDVSKMEMVEAENEYVVNGTVTLAEIFSAIQNYIGGMEGLTEGLDLSKLDLSGVAPAKTVYHFDKQTQEVTGIDIDMTDCMQALMEQLMKLSLSMLGGEGSDALSGFDISSLIKINTEKMMISLKDIDFNKEIKIELPEAAKNAEEWIPDDSGDWEVYEEYYVEEMRIELPEDFEEEEVDGYTAAFFDDQTAVLVLREDKADFVNYADNMEEYLQLVLKANESKGLSEPVNENGHPTFEYDFTSGDVTYRYYTTVFESDEAYWLVQFACDKQDYDIMKPDYADWADTVVFAH